MSFESVKASIDRLSSKQTITLNELYELLGLVADDVLKYNHMSYISEMDVNQEKLESLILSAGSLGSDISSIVRLYGAKLSRDTQNNYKSFLEKNQIAIDQLNEISKEAKKAAEAEDKLSKTKASLEKQRGYLRKAKDKCNELQEEIDALNDKALDTAQEEKLALEKQLGDRRSEFEAIEKEKDDLNRQLKEINTLIEETGPVVKALLEEKETLENKTIQLENDRAESEEAVFGIKQVISEYDAYFSNYEEYVDELHKISEQKRVQIDELKQKLTVFLTAINQMINDDFLQENLYRLPDADKKLCVKSYPDLMVAGTTFKEKADIVNYLNEVSARAEKLLNLLADFLIVLNNEAKTLTKDISDKKEK